MSSRVVKGGQTPAESITWKATASQGPPPPSVFPPPAHPAWAGGLGSPGAELQGRIAALEREIETRSQAALQQGLQQGEARARQQMAAQLETALQKLARTVEEIAGTRQRCRFEAEKDVVSLSLAIARRILHRELCVDPDAILGLVKAACSKIDGKEIHKLRIHPDHVPLIQQQLDRIGLPERLEVRGDASLECGAAVLETSRGTLDASVETQLAEIERGFADLVRHDS